MPAPDWATEPSKDEPLVNKTGPTTPTNQEAKSEAHSSPLRMSAASRSSVSRTLLFFRFLTTFTILLALLVIATNGYVIYENFNSLGARGVVLRIYCIFFAILIIFAEFEGKGFIRYFGFFENWVARGISYGFVGLITWNQDCGDSDGKTEFEDVVAYMIMGVGILYVLLGIACMRTIKEAAINEVNDEEEAAA